MPACSIEPLGWVESHGAGFSWRSIPASPQAHDNQFIMGSFSYHHGLARCETKRREHHRSQLRCTNVPGLYSQKNSSTVVFSMETLNHISSVGAKLETTTSSDDKWVHDPTLCLVFASSLYQSIPRSAPCPLVHDRLQRRQAGYRTVPPT